MFSEDCAPKKVPKSTWRSRTMPKISRDVAKKIDLRVRKVVGYKDAASFKK